MAIHLLHPGLAQGRIREILVEVEGKSAASDREFLSSRIKTLSDENTKLKRSPEIRTVYQIQEKEVIREPENYRSILSENNELKQRVNKLPSPEIRFVTKEILKEVSVVKTNYKITIIAAILSAVLSFSTGMLIKKDTKAQAHVEKKK